ncbi:MAG: polysaccharide deacetylase family protein [Patescibacteria group bacterium]|nr:polysaccharide deacetylase family protein [Patescibacteria group bacterium]
MPRETKNKTKKLLIKKVVAKQNKSFISKNKKLLSYILAIVVLLLLIGVFYCSRAHSLIKGYRFDSTPSVDNKGLEKEKVELAKEAMAKSEMPEDFNAKIKDVNFEKLAFEKNIPILMYHYIEPETPTQSTLRRNLGVTPENFEKQMKWLYDNGFKTMSLSQYFSLVAESKEIQPKTVLITIDDGYRDFFENAAPVLNRYNMKATIFIITNSVGSPAYMDWDQIRLLSDQGFEFGSHSLTHPNLKLLSDVRLNDEVKKSKEKLEQELGRAVNFFCYPTGAFDTRVESAVRAAGYRGAFTTIYGYRDSNKNMFELPRFRITHTMSIEGFEWTVNSAQ